MAQFSDLHCVEILWVEYQVTDRFFFIFRGYIITREIIMKYYLCRRSSHNFSSPLPFNITVRLRRISFYLVVEFMAQIIIITTYHFTLPWWRPPLFDLYLFSSFKKSYINLALVLLIRYYGHHGTRSLYYEDQRVTGSIAG